METELLAIVKRTSLTYTNQEGGYEENEDKGSRTPYRLPQDYIHISYLGLTRFHGSLELCGSRSLAAALLVWIPI